MGVSVPRILGACGLALALVGSTAASAQEPGSYLGFNVSEPYRSTAFGVDGRWVFGEGRWTLTGFGSAFTVGDLSSGAWLADLWVTRSLGAGPLSRRLFVGSGLRLSGVPGTPTEVAMPLVLGLHTPLLQAGEWEVGVFGHLGVARRHAGGESQFARKSGMGMEVSYRGIRFGISHDDAAGSTSPFRYGGAARLSLGFRVR